MQTTKDLCYIPSCPLQVVEEDKKESGAIAQLGERLPCKQEVSGSIPLGSTIMLYNFEEFISRQQHLENRIWSNKSK